MSDGQTEQERDAAAYETAYETAVRELARVGVSRSELDYFLGILDAPQINESALVSLSADFDLLEAKARAITRVNTKLKG